MYEYQATLTKIELHVFTCYVCECPVSAKLILLFCTLLFCFNKLVNTSLLSLFNYPLSFQFVNKP